jgi:hypothetical protein
MYAANPQWKGVGRLDHFDGVYQNSILAIIILCAIILWVENSNKKKGEALRLALYVPETLPTPGLPLISRGCSRRQKRRII